MSTLLNYFGAAYLINLPQRVDRLKAARKELARIGWDTGPSGVEVFPAQSFADRAGFPNVGTRGCFHSHLECLRRASSENRKTVLMLEDDISFSPLVLLQSRLILSQLKDLEWDFLYFGHEGTGQIARGTSANDLPNFQPGPAYIETTHFYAVNSRILSRLLAHLERHVRGTEGDQELGPMPIDGAYTIFRRHNPDVRCVIAVPKLGWQRPSRSDIMPRSFDSLRALRPVMGALRELKHLAQLWRS